MKPTQIHKIFVILSAAKNLLTIQINALGDLSLALKMTSKILWSSLVLIITLTAFETKAQMIFDTLYLDEMEIISNQFEFSSPTKSQSIDTITKKELNHLSLAELLAGNSTVFVKSYGKGGLATAAFRGTTASHTKVLWNGFEINSPMLGQVDLSLIPNIFYDEAILEYGGSSLESTSGALGGAINLNSSKNKSSETLNFVQTIGSFSTYTSSLKLDLGKKDFNSKISIYLNSSENTFSFYNNAIIPAEWQIQENASFYNRGFTQEFSYKISKFQSVEIISWNQWNFREIPPIMSNQQGGNNVEQQESFTSRNILKWKFHKSNTVIESKAAWFYEDLNYLLKTTTATNPNDTVTFINSTNISRTGFFEAKISQILKKGWLVSVEFRFNRSTVESNNYLEIKNRNTYGLFTKVSKKFADFLEAEFLIRQELVDNEFIPPMPFLGFSAKPFKTEDLFFRISTNLNYKLPSLNDLYWFLGGNSDLLPEKGIQFDAGISYSKKYSRSVNISADLSFYSSYISNWIQWIPSDYRYWTAENIAFVNARGIETGLSINGFANKLFYKISAQYSFNKSTNESSEAIEGGYSGRQLIYVPLHSGNVFAYISINKFQLNWNTQFTGKRNTSLNEETQYSNTLPSYSISNISIGKGFTFKKSEFELKFKVYNIFDKSYQAILWRPMPGRSLEVFLTIKIK